MNNLKEILDNLIKNMVEYPTLNYGGCCVFATEVAHILYEKGYYVSIKVYDNIGRGDLNIVRKNNNTLKRNKNRLMYCLNKNDVYLGHVMLEIELEESGRVLFDSEGYYDINEFGSNILKGRLTLEEARKLSETDNWNKKFNRDLIPEIKNKIESILKDLIEM